MVPTAPQGRKIAVPKTMLLVKPVVARPTSVPPQTRSLNLNTEKTQDGNHTMAVDQVIAETTDEIVNFHTEGTIQVKENTKLLHRILIDWGSVVNLMPDGVARELVLTYWQNDRLLQIRTTTGDVIQIKYYVQFDLTVAGVTARVRAYVISMTTTYTLLLG